MSDKETLQLVLDERITSYYGDQFDENGRLGGRSQQGLLEFERTQELIMQRVPAVSRIIDAGGATGVHAAPLARRGDQVILIDPVPSHVVAAAKIGTFTALVAGARNLPVQDASADAVLLLGPLYHLIDRDDRVRALHEAARIARPGGFVFAAAISRTMAHVFSSVVDVADEEVQRSPYPADWLRLLEAGATYYLRRSVPGGYFHLAEELAEERADGGWNPWEEKFDSWNALKRNATTTIKMMTSFHVTSALLIRANHRMPN